MDGAPASPCAGRWQRAPRPHCTSDNAGPCLTVDALRHRARPSRDQPFAAVLRAWVAIEPYGASSYCVLGTSIQVDPQRKAIVRAMRHREHVVRRLNTAKRDAFDEAPEPSPVGSPPSSGRSAPATRPQLFSELVARSAVTDREETSFGQAGNLREQLQEGT